MADDKHYRPGDWYQLDDNSGFKVRAHRTRMQWNNIVTLPQHYNPRQPQDLVIGVKDEQSVPVPRPRQKNQFTIVGTWVTAFAARGSFSIQVDSTVGFNEGDNIVVMLDSGENFYTQVGALLGNTIFLSDLLPHAVGGTFGDPLENSVLRLGSGTVAGLLFSDGGALCVLPAAGYPTSPISLADGSVWSNGTPGQPGAVGVVPGITPDPAAPPVFFPGITAAILLALGGGDLPLTPQILGSTQLWNNGGQVSIS